MKTISGVLLLCLVALPVRAEEAPSGCAWLCGSWVLDTAHSDQAGTAVDAALAQYKEPKPRRTSRPHSDNPVAQVDADAEAALGPIYDRPMRTELHTQLLELLTPPTSLTLSVQGDGILFRLAGGAERHVFPGEPHSRVDAEGTARIRTEWKKTALTINESYDHSRQQTETYTLLSDGTLQVTRVVDRPGVKTLRLRTIYRRG